MGGQAIATITNSHLPNHLSHLAPESLWLVSTITSILQKTSNNPKHQETIEPQEPSNILNQFSPLLTPKLVIQVIKNQTSPYHSLFFFNWASDLNPNPNNYFHTHYCYIAITDKLISHKLFSLAKQLLESHHRFSDFMVGKFIKAHGDLGHIRWAVKLFHQVKEREFGDCLFSYNAVLGVLVKDKRVHLAWGYFGMMIKEAVVKPDVSTYTILIRGFCQLGIIEYAYKMFDEMSERGCEKNLFTYNTIVNGFCKKGLMENAQRVVDEMVERGVCLPDMVTFTTLIDGYCRKGETVEAVRCFDEMTKRNVEPNVSTYNALINGLCLNGKVDEAKRMMTKMRFGGRKDNVATHTSLLKGYCAAGRSNEAIEHFKEMVGLGMELDEKSYAVIVNEFCKLRMPDKAIALLREMRVKGIVPAIYGCNAILRSFVELDEPDKAVALLKQMPQMGCPPNFLSYSAVICGLLKSKGRMRDLEILVNEMLQNGNRLDATLYNGLIGGYCEDGNVEMAIKVFLEMIHESYVINVGCFQVFVKELIAQGKLFEIENLFEQMRRRCPISEVHNYRKVLDECLC
ncbi:hypothetical protein ACH5RR_040166 [Cinchona calisaya]|uniref:Pentatricopeptide repeat-containing protein n=1 Tax=Cinchona calisaya TaxID=153742 RepID=A0ABD2XWB0_9GENT